jgi:hypothetical protein
MGWLCDRVVDSGTYAIADFICPTDETRAAFGDAFVVWLNRIDTSRFPDTDAMFQAPSRYDLRVTADSETWLGFLAKERSLLWALLRRKIRIKGSPRLLVAFGKCFPSGSVSTATTGRPVARRFKRLGWIPATTAQRPSVSSTAVPMGWNVRCRR